MAGGGGLALADRGRGVDEAGGLISPCYRLPPLDFGVGGSRRSLVGGVGQGIARRGSDRCALASGRVREVIAWPAKGWPVI